MKEETRYFYGTIHAERATNEWQRKNALPARYDTATPAEQAKMREYYNVTDAECEEMRFSAGFSYLSQDSTLSDFSLHSSQWRQE